jgi:hypothetical protein
MIAVAARNDVVADVPLVVRAGTPAGARIGKIIAEGRLLEELPAGCITVGVAVRAGSQLSAWRLAPYRLIRMSSRATPE